MNLDKLNNAAKEITQLKKEAVELFDELSLKIKSDELVNSSEFKSGYEKMAATLDKLKNLQDFITSKIVLTADDSGLNMSESYKIMLKNLEKCDEIIAELRKTASITSDIADYAEAIENFKKEYLANINDVISDISKKALICALNQAVLGGDGFTLNKNKLRTELLNGPFSTIFAGLLEKAYYFKESEFAQVTKVTVNETDNKLTQINSVEESRAIPQTNESPSADEKPVNASSLIKEIKYEYEKKDFGAKECISDFFDKSPRGYRLNKQFGRQFHFLNDLLFLELVTESFLKSILTETDIERLYRKGYIVKISGERLPENAYTYTKKTQRMFLNETVKKVSFLCKITLNKPADSTDGYKTYDGALRGIILCYALSAFELDNFAKEQFEINNFEESRAPDNIIIKISRKMVAYVICLNAGMSDSAKTEVREHYAVKGNAVLRILDCTINDENQLTVTDEYGNGFTANPHEALCFVLEYLTKLFDGNKAPAAAPVQVQQPQSAETAEETVPPVESESFTPVIEAVEEPEKPVEEVKEAASVKDSASEVKETTASFERSGEEESSPVEKTEKPDGSTRSVEDICGAIIKNGLNPRNNPEEFYTAIKSLISAGKIYEAIFYLEELKYIGEDFEALYDALKYIAVLPENGLTLSAVQSKSLSENIDGEFSNAIQTAIRITQLAFFDKNEDIWAKNDYVKFADSLSSELATPCKALISELIKLEIRDGGYTKEDVLLTLEKQARLDTLKTRANDLLIHPYKKKKSELLEPMLSKDEYLLNGLSAVKENNGKEFETIRTLSLKNYSQLNENGELTVVDSKIASETERIWKLARVHDKASKDMPLYGEALEDTQKYVKERAECINDWINLLSAESKPKYNSMASVAQAAEQLAGISARGAAAQVLKFAARRIGEFLKGEFFDKGAFLFVLGGGEILLGESGLPEDMSSFKDIEGLEPWRSATIHFTHPEKSPEELFGEYLKGNDETLTFNNYTFRLLEKILGKKGDLWFTDDQIKASADEEKKKFRSRTEKDIFYGRVDEDDKEKLFASEEELYKYYIDERHECGKYKTLCQRLLKKLEALAEEKAEEHKKQLAELFKQYADAPILKDIEKAVEKRDFYLAEWYSSRLQTGERELTEGELEEGEELNIEKFLKEYDKIIALFTDRKRPCDPSIIEAYKQERENQRISEVTKYFSFWDFSDKNSRAQKIRSLISYLGFQVTDVKKENDLKRTKAELYTLTLIPVVKTKTQYNIPLCQFGTECKKINLIYVKDESGVVAAVNEVNPKGEATIVLFDGAVTGEMRKKIFSDFKKDAKDNSFLLLDYVLGYYLARFRKSEITAEFLKCTVPYTGYKFYADDVAHLPPEMFVGREKEIGAITDFSSSYQLIYGGRQLGKTALLNRARCILNDVGSQQYAFLITLERSKDAPEQLALKLSHELIKFGLIPRSEYKTCKDVLQALEEELTKTSNKDKKVYLLIDESDDFFRQMSESGDDSAINAFVQLRRSRAKQFNFVFAGLHHVARYPKFTEGNTAMGQLSNTLPITPLSPIEARRLIEIPFSFLGIKIAPEQVAHLAIMAIYYPGIIQKICYKIVEQIISGAKSYPPYSVDEKLLEKVCSASDLNEEIRSKLKLTLDIDKQDNTYLPIAMLFSLYTFENAIPDGFTAEKVLEEAKDLNIQALKNLSVEDVRRLLDEMTHMNILRNIKEKDSYKLRMASFAKFIARKKSDAEKYFEEGNV